MALNVLDLSVRVGDNVLFRQLSFQLRPYDIVQVVGPNGIGKTTLLKTLCGLYSNYTGTVDWSFEPAHNNSRANDQTLAEKVAYCGVKLGLNQMLTPLENLCWVCELQGVKPNLKMIRSTLDFLGLSNKRHSQLGTLSSGQKQRVKIAAVLLKSKTTWVLDEPFTALDVEGAALLESLIISHADKGGSILFTTHHPLGWLRSHTILNLKTVVKSY